MFELRNCQIGSVISFIFLVIVIASLSDISIAGKSKNFLRNNFSKDQAASKNYYPASYKRFRRGYGIRDESDFNPYSFGGSGTSDSFGTFRKGSVGGRVSSQRSFQNRGFSNFGGPDAFLSPAESLEADDESDRGSSVKFGGSSGGFPGFGNSSPSWGKQSNAKGRSKGGLKKTAAAKVSQPTSINFGSESGRYIDRGGSPFNFGGIGGSNPQFGESFGNSKNFLGSYGSSGGSFPSPGGSGGSFPSPGGSGGAFPSPGGSGGAFPSPGGSGGAFPSPGGSGGAFPSPGGSGGAFPSPGGSGGSFPSPGGSGGSFPSPGGSGGQFGGSGSSFSSGSKKSFSSGGESFPNPFINPGGQTSIGGNPFRGLGNIGSFSGKVEDLSGGKGGIGKFPDFNSLDLNAFLEQLKPTTTTKKPFREISEEDKNKIFSGDPKEDDDDEDLDSFIPINFGEKERPSAPYRGKGKGKGKAPPVHHDLKTCKPAKAPLNGKMRCTSYSGCRLDCNPNYQTPDGETRLYLKCVDGEWTIAGKDSSRIPDCEPICDPPCMNEGICLAPNVCHCPDNWEGATCDKSKESKATCLGRPPTPLNTRMFCGSEGCFAKCIDGYVFEQGISKLSFVCRNGEWVIENPQITKPVECKAICDPECLNGGICLAPNLCQCSNEFRGPQCQYPISNCDPKKLTFNGGFNCTGENMDFGCKLWCPEGIDFTFPEAEFYRCDYATGKWSPSPIPKCDYSFLTHSTKEPFKHSEVIDYLNFKPKSGTCFTWSGAHYKSFDGKVYSFESGCPYTLLQDSTLGTFSINLIPEEGCKGPKCRRSLKIFTEEDQYVLGSSGDHPVLTYRDTSLAIPGQMNGLVSERVAHYVVVKLSGLGLTLKWDMKNMFVAEASELLWNRTSGLCGRLDGSKDNDWGYPDGSSEVSLGSFLKGWQATTVGVPCLEPPITRDSCSEGKKRSSANLFCMTLSDDPRFEPCREVVDVTPYITSCMWDYCGCENQINPESCACDSFAAFFRECTNSGGAVRGGWRSEYLCPMDCSKGFEYKSCMPAIQPRCGQAAETAKPEFCVEGCDCPSGLVLHEGGKCIRPEECPCTYHNKTYYSGDTIPNDCNTCTCQSGEWVCTEVKCGSRCSAVGDPHYTTFDGRKYDFMGKCSYYLVKGGDFSIEAENVPCAGAISEAMNYPSSVVSQFPSCTRSVTIRVPGTTVHLKQDREITINGEEVTDLPLWAHNVFVKKASSIFVMVYLPNKIEVLWDGQTRVYVDAPSELRGLTAGLCGTFNDNQKDDFLTPEGDIEQNPIAFANKWKTSQKCKDLSLSEEAHPCDRHVQNKIVAEKSCAKIKSKLFAKCHLEVDPESFYRNCIYDLCSCEAELGQCLCPILASYGKECAEQGIIVDWRSKVRECGVHCSGGQKYQICGDSCSHTCYDLATNPNCKSKCVEGCNCPEGFSLDVNEVCVPVSQCPCAHEGKEFKPAYEMFQKGEDGSMKLCKCEKAQWFCREPTDVERASPEFFTEPQLDCPTAEGEVYTDCMPEEEPTCLTMHLRPELQSDVCRPGCRCDTGLVRDPDTNHCVPWASCPCHHGGKSYQEGDTIVEECNTCICEEGLWSCSEKPCPATCTAWGDSHYKTFDGRMFDFHGTCDYMLAKGKRSRNDMFELSIQNVPCGTNGVTCAKSLTLRVGRGEKQEVVQFSRNKPPPMKNMTRTIIREAGVFVFAEVADMGLELQWDRGTRAYVILDPSWKQKSVEGLCGNYNGDEKDDFRTPSKGTGEVSAKIFGDSWRLQNYCPESILIKDTCALHPHRKVWASEKCATLRSPLFTPCHSEVPVDPYVERCLFDACGCDTGGDCHCLCTAIAAYAQECNIHGVYIKWRTPQFCPMQCDESCEHYEPCIPTCPMETCDSYKEPQSTLCRTDACVEGCAKDVCPPGQVHKSATDKECVPKIDCDKKCLEIDGEVYMEGDIISEDDCHTCFCTKGKRICKGTTCKPTTPLTRESTFSSTKVTTPALFSTPHERKDCRTGWSVWLNQDHPIVFKKNSDIEPIPSKILETLPTKGFCGRDMYDDIRCRSVGDHSPPHGKVSCNLEEGLRCEMPGRGAKGGRKCADYEISIFCDCSREPIVTTPSTTPKVPAPAPTIKHPETPPPIPDIPETCETEGLTPWFNVHYPTKFGEFETLAAIRETEKLCPDHYVKEVQCRPVGGGPEDPSTICDKRGAVCRNNAGIEYCRDHEVRVNCQCKCQDGLGMADGRIPDENISASSATSLVFGRLGSFDEWIPDRDPNSDMSEEWLQIDLGERTEVTGVVTQGHSAMNAYVTTFAIQVSETGAEWEEIRDPGTDYAKRFSGNTNANDRVVNLLPRPVFVRYVRFIPLEAVFLPALRVELKGCNKTEVTTPVTLSPGETTPDISSAEPYKASTTPYPQECQDGWTEWMNSHTPIPGDWDDIENYKSLRLKYSFCEEAAIQQVECRVSTIQTPVKEAGQIEVVCNKNFGLQCVDELQKDHCYDYEVRFFCDCSLTTTSVLPLVTTPYTKPPLGEPCDLTVPNMPHEKSCKKFYECQPLWGGETTLVEKECGPGTLYNPKTFVCDFPYNVEIIRPECKELDKITTPVDEVPCTDDFWTEWFNISHPDVDAGDFESLQDIRAAGLDICEQRYIKDIQCQFYKNMPSKSTKSRGKGRKSVKGRPKPLRFTSAISDYTASDDLSVTCSIEDGLICRNDRQRGRNKCEDYAIRVLCSCESKKTPPTEFTVPLFTTTTVMIPTNYTDIRTASPTTSPRMYNDGSCPPGRYYEEFAVRCTRVCIFYRQFLAQQGRCLNDDEMAPACVDEVQDIACPPGFFLRDNSTCVSITNCNCMLPNGMSAPPERSFLVSDCEICKCSNNELICDNSRCYDKPKEFECDEWSPWMSVSAPSGLGDMETLEILRRYHPEVCLEPEQIECREKKTGQAHFLTGQKVTCNTKTGFQCLNKQNSGRCKDYEVRIFCKCGTTPKYDLTTPYKKDVTSPLPPLPGCVEPYWTEWFNVTHPRIKGGDYELIDVIIRKGLDICPKPYIEKLECGFLKEIKVPSSSGKTSRKTSRKGRRKSVKGRPAKFTTRYEMTDYTQSDDMYVTCSKLSGLTCVNVLQAKSKKCEDYAIRAYCNCDPDEVFKPKEKITPAAVPTTTPYPGWPVVGPDCDENKVRAECAIECNRVCKFYRHYLHLSGECEYDSDCAPACMEPYKKSVCPDGLFMADNTTCVEVADCTCRLPNGQPLPGGMKMQVSKCEWCECVNNDLHCETTPGCVEVVTEQPFEKSTIPTIDATKSTTLFTTQPPLSLIKIKCDEWTPWMNMKRTDEGDFQRIEDLRAQYTELCELPVNISCRDAIAKLPAEKLEQTITCSTTEGLICRNDENRKDCYDYEVSLFCKCEPKKTSPGEIITTTSTVPVPSITEEPIPCDGFSPWINEHKPWLEDGDTEFKTLKQLRNKYGFCTEGHITDIECLEAATGMDTSVNKDVRCNPKFGLRCKNDDQESGVCYDFKIRYYCSCGTTTVTRPTLIVLTTPTPPSICAPDKYINLLQYVDDYAFTATSSINPAFGPASARLHATRPYGGAWTPKDMNKYQFLQIDLGIQRLVYGFYISGSSLTTDRVTSFSVMISNDDIGWSPVFPRVFTGPSVSSEVKEILLPGPVETRYIRFAPQTWSGSIALRVEIIGCSIPTPTPVYTTPKPPICDEEMGLENGEMSDNQITTSSTYNDMEFVYGKQNVRPNAENIPGISAGAWVAKPTQNEFIRFDFLQPSKLTGIVTFGREGTNDFVETYTVRYSPDGKTWSTITDVKTGDDKIFSANYDATSPVKNMFHRVIEARYLEIRPKTWNNNIAMRIEIKGCFHPYPEVTTTPAPPTTTTPPPPPYCDACPDLPADYYNKCYPCGSYQKFDGETCVPEVLCPCYHDGFKYPIGSVYETKECEECICVGNKETKCTPLQCDPCEIENERPVLTPSCGCVCKPCAEGTRLCASNNFCLEEEKWCDGIEHCPDDEVKCPTLAPPECPLPECVEDWELVLELEGDEVNCPKYVCRRPETKTPITCPAPLCPFGHDIVLIPKKPYEACPKYECKAAPTTWEPYTCPPPTCQDGYDIEVIYQTYEQESNSYDDMSQTLGNYDSCPQYKCVTNRPPLSPCPPPTCPQGYDLTYTNMKEIVSLCPTYECNPIVTTTPCPKVECPPGLQTLFIQTEGELCTPYTCIKITTPSYSTTTVTPCSDVALPVCEPGEEIYQTNPKDPCPIFKCKKIGVPPPTTGAPAIKTPTCELKNNDFRTFDGTEFKYEPCHHILARDMTTKEWQISVHQNCTAGPCNRFLQIKEENHTIIFNPDLTILWDEHSYSVSQAQKIGQTSRTFTVSKVGDALVYKSLVHSHTVIWNVDENLKIQVNDDVIYQVDGLCGLYTASPVDDRTKPDGSLATSTKEFGDSWSMPERECKEIPKKCTAEESKKAFLLCNALDSKPFTECHDVLPVTTYLTGCVDRLCICLKENKTEDECKCGVLASYITACLELKPDAKVADWRIATKCYKECPEGEIYNDCYTAPCERSCENLNDPEACSKENGGPCLAGCFCKPGLVRKGDKCVVPEECRDCMCEGYGDPHYKSFDRRNFTFNGECSYVAARDIDPTGGHRFQVITRNKRCQREPITMCTESVKVLYEKHEVEILLLPSDKVITSVNGKEIENFPMRESWIALERPDDERVMLAIPEIQLEVSYSKDNYGFNIRIPSNLFANKVEGLCGNCNFDPDDDMKTRNGDVDTTLEEFGISWLVDTEDKSLCQVYDKESVPCLPPPPGEDPCLKLMDGDSFGKCHPLEDPVAYISSCQLDMCLSRDPQKSACQSLEAYARRCAQLGACLEWRTADICPKTCPGGLKYHACGPGCVKTCDNYEELKRDPSSCPISPLDGCYCPENLILHNNTCVNESSCTVCDAEGHRVGEVWKTDNCTTCSCNEDGVAACKTKSCPVDPICNEGYILEEVPGTEDECCGRQKTCKVKPLDDCPDPVKPSEDCGYGKRLKLIEAPGICPEYACVCVDSEDCPEIEIPSDDDLKPGEKWELDVKGCCSRYVRKCTKECPLPECQEFYTPDIKPLREGECCPEYTCEPPSDSCIFEPRIIVENGFERPLKDGERLEKKLYAVGEKWVDGFCIECECNLDKDKKPVSKCLRKTCTAIEEHSDRKDYVLEEIRLPDTCCAKIVRTACIEDGDEVKLNDTYYDPINGCRSVECKRDAEGVIVKVEQMSSCDENCPLGWVYQPSPLAPLVCCGSCQQVACEHEGELKDVGEVWYSEDMCTIYECTKDSKDKIQTTAKEVQCSVPTEEEKRLYTFKETKVPNECCSKTTKEACLVDGKTMEPGEEVIDPNDNCIRIVCEMAGDGNVTRKEKEQACNMDCAPGHVYSEPEANECCGKCIQTHCVDGDKIHPIGDAWEHKNDKCYQFTCDVRDDALTTIATKKDCPYFDPECPPEEIYQDRLGCCRLCNITRETKRECQAEVIAPRETVGMFKLEARSVGHCSNPHPVSDFRRCNGQCDSRTVFTARGIEARHASECDCCRPSKVSQVEVIMKCDRGYSFTRVYENIEACECLPCESLQRDDQYVNDSPMEDLTEFNVPVQADGPIKA